MDGYIIKILNEDEFETFNEYIHISYSSLNLEYPILYTPNIKIDKNVLLNNSKCIYYLVTKKSGGDGHPNPKQLFTSFINRSYFVNYIYQKPQTDDKLYPPKINRCNMSPQNISFDINNFHDKIIQRYITTYILLKNIIFIDVAQYIFKFYFRETIGFDLLDETQVNAYLETKKL